MRRMLHAYRLYVALAAALVFLGGAYWYFFSAPPLPDDATFTEEFSLVLKDYNGSDVELSDFKHSVLIVYLWASWCPYCAAEMRNLSAMKSQFGDEITILAVNRAEPMRDAKAFTDTLGVEGLVYLLDPDDALYKRVDGYAMPETVFITERGEILFHQRGPIQLTAVEEKITELLK